MDKAETIANEFQPKLDAYMKSIKLDDIITIKTKVINTPWVQKDPEEFTAIRLPYRDIPGTTERDLRIIRLDRTPDILILFECRIDTINDRSYSIPTEWIVIGS